MVDTIKYTNIHEVADRILQHPLLQDTNFETIVQYTYDFMRLLGFEQLYIDAIAEVEIKDYRGKLPCGVSRIDQVRTKDNIYLKKMSSSFYGSIENPAYKIQRDFIFTNIKETVLEIAYKSMPMDEEGYPLILDNSYFILALEAYIKKQLFTILFDENRINLNVLQNAQQDYAFRVRQLHHKMALPSIDEMQAISNMWNKMHLTTKDFYNGFQTLTNLDTYKTH